MYHEPYHVGMYSNGRYSAVKGEVSSPDYAGERLAAKLIAGKVAALN